MRFDVRGPEFGAAHADLCAAARDMAAYAEDHGFATGVSAGSSGGDFR